MKKNIWKIIKTLLVIFFATGIVFGIYLFVVANAVSLDYDKLQFEKQTLTVFDVNGEEISTINNSSGVTYEDLPKNLINAFVSIEDKNFFSHNGIDALRILKATVKNLIALSPTKEGASTITQQLIKNTHLTSEKTITRKVQEIKLAMELDGAYSKEEIITAYLNVIYFGNSIYGINNASKKIFGKDCKDLTLSECATLAGIVKNPAKYSPLRNYENSLKRRNFIINEMIKEGCITQEDGEKAKQETIVLSKAKDYGQSYLSAVIDEAIDVLGVTENELAYGEYVIYTRYDPHLQAEMENMLENSDNLAPTQDGNHSDVLAMVCDNESGLVNAYFSSYKTNPFEFYRQPGSVIKPFVAYLPSFSSGKLYPASPVCDEEKTFDGYSPKNYGDNYVGWTNVRESVSKSINTVAVESMNNFGIINSLNYAEKFGITFEENDYSLSTALGGMTKGVTPIEITSAYMTLGNGGYYKNACFIEYITDKNGVNIYKNANVGFKQIEDEGTIYLMTDALLECVKSGTSSRLYTDKYQIAGKTGTVENAFNSKLNNDIWNLSYTSEHTVCVWMGNVNNSEQTALLNEAKASVYPTQVAKNIYDVLYRSGKPFDFYIPKNVQECAFDKSLYIDEHVLYLANEFYTSNEVMYDIFNVDILDLDVSSYEVYDEIKNISLALKRGNPCLSFDTNIGVKYVIKKSSLMESEDVVCEIIGNGEKIEWTDNFVVGGEDYEYKILAYLENYKDEEKFLADSEWIFISVPYNFWDFD